jgi:hypothetical protein
VRLLAHLLVAIVVAVATGLGTAWWMLSAGPPFGAVHRGAWVTWPEAGRGDADPYFRAVEARRGVAPLGSGEGLTFLATRDDGGAPLDAACLYRIEGTMPPARLWTLAASDTEGRGFDNPTGRVGFHSREILRREDGSFAITLSRNVQPGNWLPVGRGSLLLTLRLYDTPLTESGVTDATLPAVVRVACP